MELASAIKVAIDVKDWVAEFAVDPEAVRQFCNTKNILANAKAALDLAKEVFHPYNKPMLFVERDPEADGEWLVLDVTVNKGTANLLDSYKRFTSKWIQSTTPTVRDAIRLTLKIV